MEGTIRGLADPGVAWATAAPEAQEAADRVTGTNDEDGIAAILEEYGF